MSRGGAGSTAAVLLAGGTGTRVDGAVKPLFEVGGRTLLATAVDAARDAGAAPIIVAAPVLDPSLPVQWVREDPPGGGPAAAVVAALAAIPHGRDAPEWLLLLACDLPRADAAVRHLLTRRTSLDPRHDGLCLTDRTGARQWLTGVYRTTALRPAASALSERGRHASIRSLVAGMSVVRVAGAEDAVEDVDTWEDLHRARGRARRSPDARTPEESP
jgi:molybdopterin-guanine dinucleotide biosynthesis protein A